MNLPTWYDAGTVSVAGGSTTVTGTGTLWGGDAIMVGDLFCDLAQPLVPPQRVAAVSDDGSLELAAPWPGAGLTDAAYEIRYVGITERSTAQSRKVLEQLGDVKSWADVFVEDDAARLALETPTSPLRANYRVMVKETGAIWAKKTGAYDDWIGPAEFRGPSITLDVTEVDEVPYGVAPDVELEPVAGGYNLKFEIPRGMIIEPGTTTTVAADQDAAVTFVPITGGYRLDIAIPRGPAGNISGVTPFWQGRITVDTSAEAARAGLGATKRTSTQIAGGDWNDLSTYGLESLQVLAHTGGSPAANRPPGVGAAQALLVPGVSNFHSELLFSRDDPRVFLRSGANGALGSWAEFWTSGNLVRPANAEIDAGTATAIRGWAAADVSRAITSLAPSPGRAAVGGTANAITLTQPGTLVAGTLARFRAAAANTAATTIAFNGGAAVACRTVTGVALPAGYIRSDVDTNAIYDGAFWVLSREVEGGNNSNGNFTRWEDGTQTCTYSQKPELRNASNIGYTWTFPAAFTATPSAFSAPADPALLLGKGMALLCYGTNETVTQPAIFRNPASSAFAAGDISASQRLDVGAIGRWY